MSDPVGPLSEALKSLTARVAALEGKAGVSAPAPSTSSAPPASSGGGDTPASIAAFDAFVADNVGPFKKTCGELGGSAEGLGSAVSKAFVEMRVFLSRAASCKKPAGGPQGVQPFLAGMIAAMKDASNLKRRDEWENHAKAVCEGMGAIGWVAIEPSPAPIIESARDASVFWANKIRREWKGKDGGDNHIAFCAQLNKVWNGLLTFVKANHKTGVSWNPKGGDAGSFSGGAAATPPKAPAAKAAPQVTKGGMGSVFSQLSKIDQSSGKTAGLKAANKTPCKKCGEGTRRPDGYCSKCSHLAPKTATKKKVTAPAKKWGANTRSTAAAKPPVMRLMGNKWQIENQKEMVTIEADQIKVKHTVYIYGCTGATILVNGKCNSIILDGCKKTKLLFESVIAACEVVNCRSVQVQVKGQCATVSIDKTDGIVVYLNREGVKNTKIVTSKSSEMNVSFPGATDDDDYIERPIPEQFVHMVTATGVSSEVSELYSS